MIGQLKRSVSCKDRNECVPVPWITSDIQLANIRRQTLEFGAYEVVQEEYSSGC